MTRRSLLHRALALTIGLAAGCGGDDGGGKAATCSSLSPSDCGGDVSGNWSIQSVCGSAQVPVEDAALPAECAGTMMDVQPGTSSGTARFDNGSYSLTQNVGFTVAVQFSPACTTAIASSAGFDTATTCTAIGAQAASQGLTLTCSLQSDACNCTGSMSDSQNESGTYTVSGNQLTMTPTSSSSGDLSVSTTTFCVRSGSMIVELPPISTGAQPIHIILKKQ